MTDMEMKKKFDELKENAEFEGKIETAGSKEEIRAIFKEYGMEFTDEQFGEIIKIAESGEYKEMDDTALENVAGGNMSRYVYGAFSPSISTKIIQAIQKATKKK